MPTGGSGATSSCWHISTENRRFCVVSMKFTGIKKTMAYIAGQHLKIRDEVAITVKCKQILDLTLADGACAGIESRLDELLPYQTFGICFPHSIDRIFWDI